MRVKKAALPTAGEGKRLLAGVVRGTLAAMTMTALRQVTIGLGLVEQTPPDAILKQRAFGFVVRDPRLAFLLATRQVALVELAHWLYGAVGGAAFARLPQSMRTHEWAGPAYGLATWVAFELQVAPVLGLEQARMIRPVEHLMFAVDHLLFGIVLVGDRDWASGERRLPGRRWRKRLARR